MGAAFLGLEVFFLWILLALSVYAQGHFENVALNKPCNMSSLYNGNGPSPSLAVDGNSCPDPFSGFVSTTAEDNPWLEVNLGRPHPVHNIIISARPSLTRRMDGCVVTVDGQECYKIVGTPARVEIPFTCSSGVLNGSVVRVYKHNTFWPPGDGVEDKAITLCEVKIFSCSDGYWGSDCDKSCGNCSNSEVCDKVTGHCSSCPPGLQPPLCDTDCRSGSFGPNCTQTCSAGCADVCEKVSGHCTCKPGWLGPTCIIECQLGTYGPSCMLNCSVHCDDACDKITGNCTCKEGFIPPLCSRGEHTGDKSSTTGIVVGAVVGTVCAVLLLVIGVFLVIRLMRSRSSENKKQKSTTDAAHGTRTNLSQGNGPSDDRNLPPSSQLHSVYEAVEGKRNHGYENSTQTMASADEAKGGPSDELPSVSSAPSRDQPYEILDHQPETTYDRPQMYQNTVEHHVYSDLKTRLS